MVDVSKPQLCQNVIPLFHSVFDHFSHFIYRTPFWAALNTIISNWVWAWLLVPILYYSNAFGKDQIISNGATDSDGAILPVLNSVGLFDNTGTPLSPLKLYNTTTFNLNETAYAERGPVYITSFFACECERLVVPFW